MILFIYFIKKVNPIIRPKREEDQQQIEKIKIKSSSETNEVEKKPVNYLEFDDNYTKNRIDLSAIVSENERIYNEMKAKQTSLALKKNQITERPNSPSFVDDSSVPPLD